MPASPTLLGILNITADSFSDGGRYLDPDAALAHARALMAQGADMIDLGPASSHPDSADVGAAEEISRLGRVLPQLVDAGIPVSVDSFEPDVQLWALGHGVPYLNDIQGFPHSEIYPALASASAKLIIMHGVQGRGRAQRQDVAAADIWDRIFTFFDERLAALQAAGIARERCVLDPGMGFFLGTDPEVSLTVLREIGRLEARYDLPVLVSVSRKSFLRKMTGRDVADIGPATLAAEIFAAKAGARYIRTHAPGALRDALAVTGALDGALTPQTQ
ncbi:MAG: dihydropteroate synthase [Candidatus Phaeomarinobacter sp.]